MLSMPLDAQASSFKMKNWSDATVCRVIGEKHALADAVEYQAEAARRGIHCLEKQVLSQDEASVAGLMKNTVTEVGINTIVTPSDDMLNVDAVLEQLIYQTDISSGDSAQATTYEASIESLRPQLEQQVNNEYPTDTSSGDSAKAATYEASIEDLLQQLEQQVNEEYPTDTSADNNTQVIVDETAPTLVSATSIDTVNTATKKQSNTLYSRLVVIVAVLVASLYFVIYRQRITRDESSSTNDYDASDNIIELNNIRKELLSMVRGPVNDTPPL